MSPTETCLAIAFAEDACLDAHDAVKKLTGPITRHLLNDAIQMLNNMSSSISDAAMELSMYNPERTSE